VVKINTSALIVLYYPSILLEARRKIVERREAVTAI
jgi:hypothetical protein